MIDRIGILWTLHGHPVMDLRHSVMHVRHSVIELSYDQVAK